MSHATAEQYEAALHASVLEGLKAGKVAACWPLLRAPGHAGRGDWTADMLGRLLSRLWQRRAEISALLGQSKESLKSEFLLTHPDFWVRFLARELPGEDLNWILQGKFLDPKGEGQRGKPTLVRHRPTPPVADTSDAAPRRDDVEARLEAQGRELTRHGRMLSKHNEMLQKLSAPAEKEPTA